MFFLCTPPNSYFGALFVFACAQKHFSITEVTIKRLKSDILRHEK